jgi:hypothetical protein
VRIAGPLLLDEDEMVRQAAAGALRCGIEHRIFIFAERWFRDPAFTPWCDLFRFHYPGFAITLKKYFLYLLFPSNFYLF